MAGCRKTPMRMSIASARAVPGTGCVVWCRPPCFPFLIFPVRIFPASKVLQPLLPFATFAFFLRVLCVKAFAFALAFLVVIPEGNLRSSALPLHKPGSHTRPNNIPHRHIRNLLRLDSRQRRDPDLRRSRSHQHPRTLPRRRSGGHNVVDQQHFPAAHRLRIDNPKRPTQIFSPLMRRQPILGLRIPHPLHRPRRSRQPRPNSLPPRHHGIRQQHALVETPLPLPRRKQRDSNHRHLRARGIRQLQNRRRQPLPKRLVSQSQNPPVLQQVQHLSQLIVIGGIRHGLRKVRRSQPAQRARTRSHRRRKTRRLHPQRLATNLTQRAGLRPHPLHARATDRRRTPRRHRTAAKSAVVRKNCRYAIVSQRTGATSEHPSHSAPALHPSRRTTGRSTLTALDNLHARAAEDGPHPRHSKRSSSPADAESIRQNPVLPPVSAYLHSFRPAQFAQNFVLSSKLRSAHAPPEQWEASRPISMAITRKASPDKLNLVPVVASPPHKWWLGAMTVGFFIIVGIGLALAVRAGMGFSYDNSPRMINIVFDYVGFPGRLVQMAIEAKTHVPSLEMRQLAELSCTVVNAIVYTALLLLWFLRPDDDRLKKEHRAAKLKSRGPGFD